MNKFELDKTMEYFECKKKDVYLFKNLNIYHSGKYYVVVQGRVPYNLAEQIYKNYNNEKYLIRVNGNNASEIPTTDIYTYHIDTMEGLIAFLTETKNYYSEESNISYKNVLNQVSKSILEDIGSISFNDWLLQYENQDELLKTKQNSNIVIDIGIRNRLDKFDKLVNPISSNILDIEKSKFIVHGYKDENTKGYVLIDKESNIYLKTYCDNSKENMFMYKLNIPQKDPFEINVYHTFDRDGEVVSFETYNKKGLKRINYNLTTKEFGKTYGKKHNVTMKDKEFVIKQLDEYIPLIEELIEKNTKQKNLTRKK